MTTKIPKKLHMIWIGDESKRPDVWMNTWREKHPDWEFRLWGNADLAQNQWTCAKQMELFRKRGEWCGVADIMRYEILHGHGRPIRSSARNS